jgi:hypothetical protein
MKVTPRFSFASLVGSNERPDWRSILRRYKGKRLIAKDGYFGGGDFQAHEAVIRIEE